jgi:gamma-glutamylaminecyclotransferase
MSKTLLFVYGTLKTGQGNNHLLGGAEFVREAQTVPLYRLHKIDWHPGLVGDKAAGVAVQGEVWAVDDETLARLDEFEGCPNYFQRDYVAIADLFGGVQAYFFNGLVPDNAPTCDRWPFPV